MLQKVNFIEEETQQKTLKNFFFWYCAATVSYTHLDVYKRQIQNSCERINVNLTIYISRQLA